MNVKKEKKTATTVKKTTKAAKKPEAVKTTAKKVKKAAKKVAKKAAKKTAKKAAKKTKKKSKTKTAKRATISRRPRPPKVSLSVYDVQDIPSEQHFYFTSGHRARNVKELAEVMDEIEQEIFESHVNMDKNDFYNWVRHVFEDLELAEKLIGVTGPKHLQFTIYKHVADKALKKKK